MKRILAMPSPHRSLLPVLTVLVIALTSIVCVLGNRAQARQLGGGSCSTTAEWPEGPLFRAPYENPIEGSRSLDCIVVGMVQVADPNVSFNTTAIEEDPGVFWFAIPANIASGAYSVTLTLFPLSGSCPEVVMGPMVYDVE
jgi:hypothetical protein